VARFFPDIVTLRVLSDLSSSVPIAVSSPTGSSYLNVQSLYSVLHYISSEVFAKTNTSTVETT
jgi:hypothetical protein